MAWLPWLPAIRGEARISILDAWVFTFNKADKQDQISKTSWTDPFGFKSLAMSNFWCSSLGCGLLTTTPDHAGPSYSFPRPQLITQTWWSGQIPLIDTVLLLSLGRVSLTPNGAGWRLVLWKWSRFSAWLRCHMIIISDTLTQNNTMELLYICDLKGEWLDFIDTFSQLLPGLVAGALGLYVLCGVVSNEPNIANRYEIGMKAMLVK